MVVEFGAKPYTEDEKKELSEIVQALNERHGTQFSEADMIRFDQFNRDILDEDLSEMLRNNPTDVVYSAFSQAFFQGAIRLFQRDHGMSNIVLSDPEARVVSRCFRCFCLISESGLRACTSAPRDTTFGWHWRHRLPDLQEAGRRDRRRCLSPAGFAASSMTFHACNIS